MMRFPRSPLLLLLLLAIPVAAQSPAALDGELAPLQFLVGDWVADPTAGQGTGWSEFHVDLQGKVLVRRNHAAIPATKERPAAVHDDLLVMFVDSDSKRVRGDYHDSEGHVIRYLGEKVGDARLILVSEAAAGAPRFRLSYEALPDGGLRGAFEIAPRGQSEAFSPYLAWTARRALVERRLWQ